MVELLWGEVGLFFGGLRGCGNGAGGGLLQGLVFGGGGGGFALLALVLVE